MSAPDLTEMLTRMKKSAGVRTSARTSPPAASAVIMTTLGFVLPAAAAQELPAKYVATSRPYAASQNFKLSPKDVPVVAVGESSETSAAPALHNALAFAAMVERALPIDEEMNRLAERALRAASANRTKRKLSPK